MPVRVFQRWSAATRVSSSTSGSSAATSRASAVQVPLVTSRPMWVSTSRYAAALCGPVAPRAGARWLS
ncbi:hypothetical protein [Amycolatopsis samaneae]|uniref:Uncharacterized protein n=1 Tax=Amycolatopsis samaneae TaxID=664691 RepID=A0ABW5GXH4_9PSEU